jgi:hypothetical protein
LLQDVSLFFGHNPSPDVIIPRDRAEGKKIQGALSTNPDLPPRVLEDYDEAGRIVQTDIAAHGTV